MYYVFAFDLLTANSNEHHYIRMNRIAQHTGQAEHGLVYILHAGYCAIVIHTDIDGSAVSIDEGQNFFFQAVSKFALVFCVFIFLVEHCYHLFLIIL